MEEDNKITGNNQNNLFRIRDIVGLILFVVSLLVSIYQIIIILDLPLGYGRIVSYLILTLSLPVMIFLAIGLLRHFTHFIKKSWIFYIFQFLIALILPLVIMGNIEDKIQKKILTTVKNEMTPIITYIEEYRDQHNDLPENITNGSIKPHTLSNISYVYSSNIFILETDVPSIDIDGAKIFYDSRDKQWYQFHNDEYQYYHDKKEKPKSIENYISLQEQTGLIITSLKKIDEEWIDPKEVAKKNSQEHLKRQHKRCEENHGASCTAVGMRYGMGLEAVQSDTKALEYFTKACELEDKNGCEYLAGMYARVNGIQKNTAKSVELYKKACRLGINKKYCTDQNNGKHK